MPVETSPEGQMERTPLTSPDTLRVRCPHCRKLYMVQFNDIQESKPRFECVQCHSRFWLSLPDLDLSQEVFGLPLQVKDAPRVARAPALKKDPCPKCFKPVASSLNECPSCGIVIEKARSSLSFVEGLPPHSGALATAWKRVVAEYGDENLHGEFLKACQRERNLAFAGHQYAQMQKLMPTDEITLKRLGEVQALGATLVPPASRDVRVPRAFPRLYQIPLMAATLTMIVGMMAPMFRNLVGLGALLLFIGAAFHLHFNRRP